MSHQTDPLVSIITLNYNGAKLTCELLDSLKKVSYPNKEVIVLDNGSTENADHITTKHPWIKFIRSEKNLGFAGGNNLCMRHAKGKYLMLLNNDTEVHDRFLEPMVEMMEMDERLGAVSPKIEFHDKPGILKFAGFNPTNSVAPAMPIGSGQRDDGRFNQSNKTTQLHPAAMMLRGSLVREIGALSDLYFLYYVEKEYSEKIKNAGYSIWYCAPSKIYHKSSGSKKYQKVKTYYLIRNRILFLRRNAKGAHLFASYLFILFITLPKNTLMLLIKGQAGNLAAFYSGIIWNLTHFKTHKSLT